MPTAILVGEIDYYFIYFSRQDWFHKDFLLQMMGSSLSGFGIIPWYSNNFDIMPMLHTRE